jgi:hypothetical protein
MLLNLRFFLWVFAILSILPTSDEVCSSLNGQYCSLLNGAHLPTWGHALHSKNLGPSVAYNPNRNRRN